MDNMELETFVLTDEEGVEHEFELWDIVEEDGNIYYGLIPHEASIEEDTELVILKVGKENGEEYLATIDNDEEYDRIGKIFLDLADEEDSEEEDA